VTGGLLKHQLNVAVLPRYRAGGDCCPLVLMFRIEPGLLGHGFSNGRGSVRLELTQLRRCEWTARLKEPETAWPTSMVLELPTIALHAPCQDTAIWRVSRFAPGHGAGPSVTSCIVAFSRVYDVNAYLRMTASEIAMII
jgi:hypothetical protein